MNLAFVIPTIKPGGAERVVVRLANFAASRGVHVFLFVTKPPSIDYGLDPAVTLLTLPKLGESEVGLLVERHKIDVISDHYHWSLSHIQEMAALARSGVKVILSEHNSYFYPLFQVAVESNPRSLELYYNRPQLYKNFAAITSLTRFSANLLNDEGATNVALCYNPLSYESQSISDLNTQRVLSVSSFVKRAKRIDLLFEVFALVSRICPEARLRVVGELDHGRLMSHLDASAVNGNVIELIGVSNEVRDHYLSSSVFAMTSEIEGQPMVLLEAALHGLPQVVYNIPGLEDQIIDGETGFIVDRDDSQGYAYAVRRLLKDKALRQRLGRQARDFVLRRFALEKVGSQWLQLFDDVYTLGRPSAETLWSPGPEEARRTGAAALLELNTWFRRVLNPNRIPVVSIIVPVYGTEEFLGRCLRSLSSQIFKDIEIIVVNDGSPGNVEEIVREHQRQDNRICYHAHPGNRGLYQARSTGARLARGAYLAHVDSDDYVHPDFIRRMHGLAVQTGADIVECQAIEITPNGERRPFCEFVSGVLRGPDLREAYFAERIRHVVWNKLYRRSLWDAALPQMEESREFSITEDLLRNTPLFLACRKYTMAPEALYYYARRPDSVVTEGSFSAMLRKIDDIVFVYDRVIAMMREAAMGEEAIEKVQLRRVRDAVWYMQRGFSSADDEDQEVLATLKTVGLYGAAAARLAFGAGRICALTAEHGKLADETRALQVRYEQCARDLETSEAARLWEKERADYLTRQLMPVAAQ